MFCIRRFRATNSLLIIIQTASAIHPNRSSSGLQTVHFLLPRLHGFRSHVTSAVPKSVSAFAHTTKTFDTKTPSHGKVEKLLEVYLSLDSSAQKNFTSKQYLLLIQQLRKKTPRHQFAKPIARVVSDLIDSKPQLSHAEYLDLMFLTSNISHHSLTIDIFQALSASDISPNKLAYNVALNSAVQLKNLSLMKTIFCKLNQTDILPDIATYTILMKGYLLHAQVSDADQIFVEIHAKQLQPTLSTYNVYIKGLANLNQIDKALDVYRKMKYHGVIPDMQLLSTMIDGLFKNRRRALVHEIWLDMVVYQLKPNLVMYNTIIDGFMKCKQVSAAEQAFDQMISDGGNPDIVTYTLLIHGYIKNACIDKAVVTWKQAIASQIPLDTILFNCLFNAFFDIKDQEHKHILSDLLSDIPEIQHRTDTFNIIIKNTTTVSSLQDALGILDTMARENLSPSLVTYLLLMTSLIKSQDLPGAVKLYAMINESPVKPDLIVHGVMMKAYVNFRDVESARKILENLIESGAQPNHILFSIVAQGYAQGKDVSGVKWIYQRMSSLGVVPDTYFYNVVAKSYLNSSQLSHAKSLFHNMTLDPQFRPNDDTFYILIEGFLRHQETHMALKVFNYMKSIRYVPKRTSLKHQVSRIKDHVATSRSVSSPTTKSQKQLKFHSN